MCWYIYLAKAVLVRDFREQVQQRYPPDTFIPSDELIRLQFVPARKSYNSAAKYTCWLEVKKLVQQRQWRKENEDSHYGACIIRYKQEYDVSLRRFAVFVCQDDKHRVTVGDPGFPLAAGRYVLIHTLTNLQAGDHDFFCIFDKNSSGFYPRRILWFMVHWRNQCAFQRCSF